MYKNILCTLLIASFLFIDNYSIQAGNDKAKWRHLDKRLLTSTTIAALERWHTDSLGCMNLRKWDDGQLLIKRFKLENADKDSVTKVLGDPSFIVDAKEFTTWSYFIHTWCENGVVGESEKSIMIEISLETNKVTDVRLALH